MLVVSAGCGLLLGDLQIEGNVATTTTGAAQPQTAAGAPTSELATCSEAGSMLCEGRALRRCTATPEGLRWATVSICASEALCVTAPEAECLPPACEPGEVACRDLTLVACRTDLTNFETLSACASAAHCDSTSARCLAQPCTAGQLRCNEGRLEQCGSDATGWDILEQCATQGLCEATLATCGPNGCQQGNLCLSPVCEAGSHRCNGGTFERCGPSRASWETEQVCESAALCSPDGCVTPGCELGQLRCTADGGLEECSPDRSAFLTRERCVDRSHCDVVLGRCGEPRCEAGTRRCAGQSIVECLDGQSGYSDPVQQCASAALCREYADDGRATAECSPPACSAGQYECRGAELWRCNADQNAFERADTCLTDGLCRAAEGRCLPSCAPGERSCGAGQLLFECQITVTRTGSVPVLQPIKNCQDQGGCNPSTRDCGDPCTPTPRCNGTLLERCSETTGWRGTNCASAELCQASLASAQCAPPACESGERRCNGQQLEQCSTGRERFEAVQNCAADQICDAVGGQCDVCSPSAARCDGDELVTCSADGQRELRQPCGAGLCSAAEGRCLACAPAGALSCAGADLLLCAEQNGERQVLVQQTCDSPALCDATAGRCRQCTINGARRCLGSTVVECLDGQERVVETCASAALCQSEQGTALCRGEACQPGQFRCTTTGGVEACNDLQTGFVATGRTCANAALCDAVTGRCLDPVCAPGQSTCRGALVLACNATRTALDVLTQTCATPDLCRTSGLTASCEEPACSPGSRRCEGASLVGCNGGLSDASALLAQCDSAALCEATLERNPAALACDKCITNVCAAGILVPCVNGVLGAVVPCATRACNAAGTACAP